MAVTQIAKKLATLFNTAPALLTAQDQLNVRTNVYASPLDALATYGMQINGAMDYSQENGSTPRSTDGYVVDGWRLATSSVSGAQIQSQQMAGAGPGGYFPNCVRVQTVTAKPTLGAADTGIFYQVIEGSRVAPMNWGTALAMPLSIGFWIRTFRAGSYSLAVTNPNGTRSYSVLFTTGTNTYEWKTFTIPGETTGTWPVGNTAGLNIFFGYAVGTTYQGGLNAWANGNFLSAPGATNVAANVNDYIDVTGFVAVPGSDVPTAARSPLILRSVDREHSNVSRYYQKVTVQHRFPASSNGQYSYHTIGFHGIMRATPTVAIITAGSRANVNSPPYPLVGAVDQFAVAHYLQSLAAGDCYALGDVIACDARF